MGLEVQMIDWIVSPEWSKGPGELHTCGSVEEKERMIQAGLAVAIDPVEEEPKPKKKSKGS